MAKLNYNEQDLRFWAQAVSREFYEIVYSDDWFKEIFKSIQKEFITSQQADFALGALGILFKRSILVVLMCFRRD